jgi:hypothetical protein
LNCWGLAAPLNIRVGIAGAMAGGMRSIAEYSVVRSRNLTVWSEGIEFGAIRYPLSYSGGADAPEYIYFFSLAIIANSTTIANYGRQGVTIQPPPHL